MRGGRGLPTAAILTLGALAASALLAGCGSIFGSSGSTSQTTNTSAATGPKVPKPSRPLDAPKPRESVQTAERRIAKLAAGDCKQAYKLNPLGTRPALNNQGRCRQLQGLAGLPAGGADTFKGGAVVDYSLGVRTMSLVLIRDRDGRLRVAFPDYYVTRPSVGTPPARGFDAAALKAVKALRTHNCSLFQRAASQELGPASAGQGAACDYAGTNPVATLFSSYPEAKIQRLGGDANFAFYGIGSPYSYFTLVFARETPADYFPTGKSLSKDAPTYGFAGIYLTGQRKPQAKGTPRKRS